MISENGRGTLIIRDVKEADQGAYTCEAINAKGLVFGIPDGVLSLTQVPNGGTVALPRATWAPGLTAVINDESLTRSLHCLAASCLYIPQ